MNTKRSTSTRLLLMALVAALSFFAACSDDYDNLRKDVDDLRLRVEKLEDWCSSANSQISALQGLVAALEANDYVTGITPVMEGTLETGYTIQFSKSGPITIRHGKDGADGLTPLIGTAKDTDGRYYWTVQTGDADPQWLTDAEGNKIPTTGKDGSDGTDAPPPAISVATFEGSLYWQVNGQWLLDSNNAKVPATGPAGTTGSQGPTGPQGDAVFAPNGVAIDNENGYVTFTLSDKVTTFRLPLYGATVIRFENNEPLVVYNKEKTPVPLFLPPTFTKNDYNALMAEVAVPYYGDVDIVTRADSYVGVELEAPTFNSDGTVDEQPVVYLTPDAPPSKVLLRVTLVHSDGHESTVSRVIVVTKDILYNYTIEEQLTLNGIQPALQDPDQPNSATNPYLIKNAENLQWIKRNPKKVYHYKLMKDIQITGTGSEGNWVPIGDYSNDFQGYFDGNGKNISGNIVASAGYKYFGFFGCCNGAEIRNLHYTGTMDLSKTDATRIGAIAGTFSGTIKHCSNSANLTCEGDNAYAGGIVGFFSGSTDQIDIEACVNTGNIVSGGNTGGIIGDLSVIAVGCINKGKIIKTSGPANKYVGGIGGQIWGSAIACWSTAEQITHENNGKVGGIAGYMSFGGKIEACCWQGIQGVAGIGKIGPSSSAPSGTLFESFTGDRPTTEEIRQMNQAWEKVNPSRKYQFNADTGEIEDKP